MFDSTIRYDLRFFESLDAMVQAEPWLERDKAMIDPLKTIGIERGKPFKPGREDAGRSSTTRSRKRRPGSRRRYDALPPFYEGEHWFFPATEEMFQSVMSFWRTPDSYPIDARGTAYTLAFFSAKHLGESQYYLLTGKRQGRQAARGQERPIACGCRRTRRSPSTGR